MTVSLRTKLILLVLAAIAGAVIVSTAMFVVRESTQHARATQERLTATADVFASTVSKSLETGDRTVVYTGGYFPQYVATGHLLFMRGTSLMAVAFDLETLKVGEGPPVPVIEGIVTNGWIAQVA